MFWVFFFFFTKLENENLGYFCLFFSSTFSSLPPVLFPGFLSLPPCFTGKTEEGKKGGKGKEREGKRNNEN